MPGSKSQTELLNGTCQDILFSPKGGIEGLLLKVGGETVQVSMPPHLGSAILSKTGPGKRVRLLGRVDDSPKAHAAVHPVYVFEALADGKGQPVEWPVGDEGAVSMRGKVARIHFAKHGEPNGVVLESGEFIHLRPHGMSAIGAEVGSEVSAHGELRMTVLGTRMLEAAHANGYDIE
jgi:hypothetical protein